jgi:hypothetical protein
MFVWTAKDPDETARREIDWEKHPSWQRGDTIATATFTLSTAAGLAVASSSHDCRHTSWAILTGGTLGDVGKVLGEVATNGGQTLQTTATMLIESR